jgi:hypothetical protein
VTPTAPGSGGAAVCCSKVSILALLNEPRD